MKDINRNIVNATKWGMITEILAKLIMPITNIILARILVPEEFGVISTVTMIISFVDMFTDAGFQKYLIQNEFKTDKELNEFTDVAFWTNLCVSIFFWGFIILFSDKIAILVGNPGLGNVISISCVQLIITSFSSIQMARYRRNFDFKSLFKIRIITICIPFIITIPLAIVGFSYWALIIGNIIGNLISTVYLTIKSTWKPKLYYKFYILKKMISFSIWTLIESISIWLTSWIDMFIIGSLLDQYYLGIYKSSISMVNSLFLLITSATTPVLFSALSRLQNNKTEFDRVFFSMQKAIAYLVIPMSFGIFMYKDLAVNILFGKGWNDANSVVGIWGFISGIVIVFGHYSSEVYRAKGKPKLSFLSQVLHLIVLIPICIIFSGYNFEVFTNIRAIVRLQSVLVNLILLKLVLNISIKKMFANVKYPILGSVIMFLVGNSIMYLIDNFIWRVISIIICVLVYIVFLFISKESRNDCNEIIRKIGIDRKIPYFDKILYFLNCKVGREVYER